MVIGDSSLFAVEYEVEENHHGVWLVGKFCFKIRNVIIGDFSFNTSLRDILFQMIEVLRDSGNRSHDILYSLSSVELYERLNEALYGYGTSIYDDVALSETWARFNAKMNVDVFDGWKIFVVENAENARIVVSNQEDKITEFILSSGLFDKVLGEAYEQLNNLYENELLKENQTQ